MIVKLIERLRRTYGDAAGTSNLTSVRLTRQKSALFQLGSRIRLTQSLSWAAWHSKKAGIHHITVRADPVRARDAPASARAANAIENRIRLSERIGQFMELTHRTSGEGGPPG